MIACCAAGRSASKTNHLGSWPHHRESFKTNYGRTFMMSVQWTVKWWLLERLLGYRSILQLQLASLSLATPCFRCRLIINEYSLKVCVFHFGLAWGVALLLGINNHPVFVKQPPRNKQPPRKQPPRICSCANGRWWALFLQRGSWTDVHGLPMSFKAVCEVMAEIELVVSFIALSQIFVIPQISFSQTRPLGRRAPQA